ncbi:MAG: hypothetical protein WCZ90_19770 [Melioribacteraceae bacterium]
MKSYFLFLFILSALLCSCESTNEPIINGQEYFSLSIGNKWYYNTRGADKTIINETLEVTAQKEINAKKYYELVRIDVSFNYRDTIYYRFSGNILFSKSPQHDERIIADFSLSINEYAYWDSIGDLKVTEKTESTITYARPFSADYGSLVTYEKGIGIIKSLENGFILFRKDLVKAEIK